MKARRCQVLTNWSINDRGECKRHHLCDEDRHIICKANPVGYVPPRKKRSKSKCSHENMRNVPTGEIVKIGGIEKKVYLSICDDCGVKKRLVE